MYTRQPEHYVVTVSNFLGIPENKVATELGKHGFDDPVAFLMPCYGGRIKLSVTVMNKRTGKYHTIEQPRRSVLALIEDRDLDHVLGCLDDNTIDLKGSGVKQVVERLYFCSGTTIQPAFDGRIAIVRVNPELCHRPDIYAGATADAEERAVDELYAHHADDRKKTMPTDTAVWNTIRKWQLGRKF
jgi:hypothetical protein